MKKTASKFFISLAFALSLAPAAHADDGALPALKFYKEVKNDAMKCEYYYANARTISPSTLDVDVYTTCTADLTLSSSVKVPVHRSSANTYRVDCRANTASWLGGKWYKESVWKKYISQYQEEGELRFVAMDSFMQGLVKPGCDAASAQMLPVQ